MPADLRTDQALAQTASPAPNETMPQALWIATLLTPLCKFSHKLSSRATGTYAVHEHPFYEMVYVLSGNVEFYVAGYACAIRPGSLITVPPGVRHGVLVRDSSPYERYTLHFDPAVLSVSRRMQLLQCLPTGLTGVVSQEQALTAIWTEMEHSGILQTMELLELLSRNAAPEQAEALVPIQVENVLAMLTACGRRTQRASGAESSRPSSLQREILAWLDEHYTEPVTLASLADHFFLSKGYLNTLFKKATGTTVKDYVRTRRLNHVRMLLSAGIPATQAAARAGFGDYTTFYRTYVQAYGHAPSQDGGVREENPLLTAALQATEHPMHDGRQPIGVEYPDDGAAREDPSMLGGVYAEP